MKTFIIGWRYYLNSYPEVSYIEAKDESEALKILREEEGWDIVIESVECHQWETGRLPETLL